MPDKNGALTPDDLQNLVEFESARGGRPVQRIISVRAWNLLGEIQRIEPGWENFTCDYDVYFKANELGIKD